MPYELDWPEGFERTDPDDRQKNSPFSTGFRRTESELANEMERMGVESWWMDDVKGSGGDPGVVVRWSKDGEDFAVGCDRFVHKKDNIREIYWWIKETRKRSERGVETGQSEFAAAKLPSGDDDAIVVGGEVREPHEILGVQPDAPEEVIKASAKRLSGQVHPDQADDEEEEERLTRRFKQIQQAKQKMLDT